MSLLLLYPWCLVKYLGIQSVLKSCLLNKFSIFVHGKVMLNSKGWTPDHEISAINLISTNSLSFYILYRVSSIQTSNPQQEIHQLMAAHGALFLSGNLSTTLKHPWNTGNVGNVQHLGQKEAEASLLIGLPSCWGSVWGHLLPVRFWSFICGLKFSPL